LGSRGIAKSGRCQRLSLLGKMHRLVFIRSIQKTNIDIPHKGRKSLVVWVKTTLEHIFSPIEDEKVWTNLNELRIVANTIKHANSGKYKELSALHIEYFQMIESDCFDDIQEYENRFLGSPLYCTTVQDLESLNILSTRYVVFAPVKWIAHTDFLLE
jgi:hypothetical protein